MTQNSEQPKDYPTARESIAAQDWSGVAKQGISSMTPADKGWILAFVIIFAIFQAANYLTSAHRHESTTASSERIQSYFELIEANRAKMEENRAQENRELLRIVENLTQTLTRQHDRLGRAQTQAKIGVKPEVKQ